MNIISQKKLYSPLITAAICLTFLFAACQAEGDCTQDTRTSVGTAFFQPVLGAKPTICSSDTYRHHQDKRCRQRLVHKRHTLHLCGEAAAEIIRKKYFICDTKR